MAEEDTTEENRQFEQVLNRLDALMKRSHASVPIDEPGLGVAGEASDASVPVLTEVYRGAELLPVSVAEHEAPPLLTEFISAPQLVVEASAVEALASVAELPMQPWSSREQEVESVVAELMPRLREMIARVVQEEIFYAQQNLSLRISQEAEQVLRLRLLQGTKPK